MLVKLVPCLALFYAAYYVITSVLCAILETDINGIEPFDHHQFNPGVASGDAGSL